MKQKHLITSTLLVTLCLATAIAAFVINTTDHSHAAETKSQTSTIAQHSHAIVNGNVYYGTNSNSAYALNATTGKLIWRYTATGPVNSLSLSLNANRVYFATTNTAYALKASNGTLLWHFQSQTFIALWSPAIVNDSMYLSDDYGVTALNASNSAVRWQFSSSAFVTPGIVKGGTVYFVAGDNAVHAVNAATGRISRSVSR